MQTKSLQPDDINVRGIEKKDILKKGKNMFDVIIVVTSAFPAS
jgi:hypothetical protein